MTDSYDSRRDRPEEKSPVAEYFITFFLGVLVATVVSSMYLYLYEIPKIEARARAVAEAAVTTKYKDDIWFSKKSKEFKLPPYTDEEAFCEAQGRCGPARQTLMGMLEDEKEKFKGFKILLEELLKNNKRLNKMWVDCETYYEELWDELRSHMELSEEGQCLAHQLVECLVR